MDDGATADFAGEAFGTKIKLNAAGTKTIGIDANGITINSPTQATFNSPITMSNKAIYGVADPTWDQDAVNKRTMNAKEDIKTQVGGGAASIQLKFWKGTQAQYDAIGTKDASTLYVIV